MSIISGSTTLRKPTYGSANEGQKLNVYRETFTANWRCQHTKVILNTGSSGRGAEYLLSSGTAHGTNKPVS